MKWKSRATYAAGLGVTVGIAFGAAALFGDWPMRGRGAAAMVITIAIMAVIYDRTLKLCRWIERSPSKPLCGVTDGAGLEGRGEPYGCCNRPYDHYGVVHTEMRSGELWAQWRSVLAEDELTGSPERTAYVRAGLHRIEGRRS